MAIVKEYINEILSLNGNALDDRESEELEFKEQFSLAGLSDYYKSFAGFANNRGGHLVYGIQNSPRIPVGLTEKSLEQFKKIDPQKITQDLLEVFSTSIQWEQAEVKAEGKTFGIFRIHEATTKPIIAKKTDGKNQPIRAGEIYYRYAGRTQKIQYAELEAIIQGRIQVIINQWMDLMSKIAQIGPQNVTLLNTEKRSLEASDDTFLTINEELFEKIEFIKKGNFSTVDGVESLEIVGDVRPILGVIQEVKENILTEYPLSATEVAKAVKDQLPEISRNKVWETIKNENMKNNEEYSIYNFRNKKQEDSYKETRILPSGTPSIYNHKAVEFIIVKLKSQDPDPQTNDQNS